MVLLKISEILQFSLLRSILDISGNYIGTINKDDDDDDDDDGDDDDDAFSKSPLL